MLYLPWQQISFIIVNSVFHERTEYFEINWHVVRDNVLTRVVHLMPITSKEQVADILTKSLHFGPFKGMIEIIDIHLLWGECKIVIRRNKKVVSLGNSKIITPTN